MGVLLYLFVFLFSFSRVFFLLKKSYIKLRNMDFIYLVIPIYKYLKNFY